VARLPPPQALSLQPVEGTSVNIRQPIRRVGGIGIGCTETLTRW